ncbi:MAG TPA: TonB-dependent receptor [Bacteroidota bacterium]|nr:TonB-dependent receptor [Bacteroidota bacterium]
MRTLSIVMLILFATSSRALLAQHAAISGTVTSSDGAPLSAAHVALPDALRGVVADEQGRFYISGVEAGRQRLRVTHVGFRVEEREIVVEQGATLRLTITLQPTTVDMGEVRVSATRSEELVRNVPLPMQVAVSEQLLRAPSVGIADALDAQPGVALIRDGVWGTDVSIRGLGRSNVVTLVDGARIETATNHAAGLSLVDINDVDRVEVIRGAASTLYGSGATGGVVNIISGSGHYSDAFRFSGALGSGYGSANNGATGTLALDASATQWFARLSSTLRSAEDVRTPLGTLRDSRYHDHALSASAGLRPWDGQEVSARYQRVRAEDVGIPGGASFPANASARYPMEERELFTAAWTSTAPLPAVRQLTLRYVHQLIERDVELRSSPVVTLRPSAEHSMHGVQLLGNLRFGERHNISSGVDAWQRRYTGRRLRENAATKTTVADMPLPNATFRSIGVFAQDEIALFDGATRITVGGRADLIHVWNDEAYNILYIESNGVRNTAPPSRVLRWTAAEGQDVSWSAYAGVLHRVSGALDLTLNLARSFRAPALEERYQYIELGGSTYIGDPDLASEQATALDLGVRLRHERVSVTANAFANFMNDLVVDRQVLDTLYVKDNVGEARLLGGELGVEYNPVARFVLYGTLSYVRGRDTGKDSDLPAIPPLTAVAGLRLPLWDLGHADVSLMATDDQEHVATGEKSTPGTAVVNARLRSNTLRFAGLGVQLFAGVENLFDRAWRRHISTLRGLVNVEPGRNVYVRVRMLW